MSVFINKNGKYLLLLVILIVLTVLLCVPATIPIFIGVFGYVAYLYLVLGYIYLFLIWKKIPLKVANKTKVLIILSYIFIVSTIHIALCGKDIANGGFGMYVTGAYETSTVGGVIFSLITSPLVLTLKYIASIIIFFVGASITSFLLLKSFIFVDTNQAEKTKKPKLYNEKLEEEPFASKVESIISTPVEDKKAKTKAVQEDIIKNQPPQKQSARELLFGDIKNEVLEDIDIESKSYGIKNYSFEPKENVQTDLMEGLEKYLPLNKKQQVARESATKKLFGQAQEEVVAKPMEQETEKVATIGMDIAETMGYNAYIPTETIFNNEKVEEEIEQLPTMQDSSFLQATRQQSGQEPAPIVVKQQQKVVTEKPKAMLEVNSEQPSPANAPQQVLEQDGDAEQPTQEQRIFGQKWLPYKKPPLDILIEHPSPKFSPYVENYEELKEVFEEKLKNYNIDVKLVKAIKGPTITICVLDLSEKCPISKVYSAKMDIQRLLHSQKEINIIPQYGNSAYFGIEIPNKVTATVSFKEIISSPDYINAKGEILLALGKTADGKVLVDDLGGMPHALIAGTTGSGKSVCINVILASILYRYSPAEIKLVLIDLKTVEMAPYADLPHMLFNNPLYDVDEINNALKWLREETMRRYSVFKEFGCRNLKEYNQILKEEEQLPRIVIIIDEASELMTDPKSGKAMDASLCSLARMARAAGIHLIFATQNPVKEVITNEIQNNLNTKIAFKVGDYNHSMVIFKAKGAETLLGRGDMYIKKGTDMLRAQCAYIDTKEIELMVDYIKRENSVQFDYEAIETILKGGKESREVEEIKTTSSNTGALQKRDLENDENFQFLVREGLRICLETNKISTSLLQREMRKSFNAIAPVVEYMEKKEYITPLFSGNKRNILITKEMFNQMYPEAPIE